MRFILTGLLLCLTLAVGALEIGLKHYTEAYRTLLAQLRSLTHQVRYADMDLLDAWEELVGLVDPPCNQAQQAQAGEL